MRAVLRLCLVFLASIGPSWALSAQELTEEQAVALFRDRSPDVRALRHRVTEQAQQNRLRTLVANPMVWYTQENAARVRDDFLQFRQPIPITGRRGLFDTANRKATASVEAMVEYEVQQLEATVRSRFGSLLRSQQRETALGESLREIDETVRILVVREREGEGSRFDRLRGERELAEIQATLAGETIARARVRADLAGLVGMTGSAEALVAVATPSSNTSLPPVDRLVEHALRARADLRAGASRVDSVEAEHQAGRRLRFPQPSVTGGLKRTRVDGVADTGYAFGVELTLPFSNRGQTETAQAAATAVRLSADQDALRLRVEREVRRAYQVATLTRRRARDYSEAAAASGETLALIARLAYEEGELGILELLDAHRVALSGRLRGIDLLDDARQAEIELSRVVGDEVTQ